MKRLEENTAGAPKWAHFLLRHFRMAIRLEMLLSLLLCMLAWMLPFSTTIFLTFINVGCLAYACYYVAMARREVQREESGR